MARPDTIKSVHFECPQELYRLVEKRARHKSVSQAIRELMADYVDRLDLADMGTVSNSVIRKLQTEAEIALAKMQAGVYAGWRDMCKAIHDMGEYNQLSMAANYMRIIRMAFAERQPGRRIAKIIDETALFLALRASTLRKQNHRTWLSGPPASTGHYLIIRKGEMQYEYAEHPYCIPINDASVEWHTRINSPPCPIGSGRSVLGDSPELPDPLQDLTQMILDPLERPGQSVETRKS